MSFCFVILLLSTLGSTTFGQDSYLLATDTDAFLTEPLKTDFRCVKTGYFADIDNNCQMYHVCVKQRKATGHEVVRQFSFVCGNGTIFNQLTMICDAPDESIPCEDAPKFYRLNSKFGHPDVPLHHGNDWEEGYNLGDDPYVNEYDESASARRISSVDYYPDPYYSDRSYLRTSYADPYYHEASYAESTSLPTYNSRVYPETRYTAQRNPRRRYNYANDGVSAESRTSFSVNRRGYTSESSAHLQPVSRPRSSGTFK